MDWDKFVETHAKQWFDIKLTKGEIEIASSVLNPEIPKVCISAYTRYGKTFSVAFAVSLYLYYEKNKRVRIVAPKTDQTKILRNFILNFIVNSPIKEKLPVEVSKEEKLKTEMNKKTVDFTNGNSLKILTAGGDLTGFGSDLLVIDEACKIPDEKYLEEINRMIEGQVVELSNPRHRNNFFFRHWNDDRYKQIHVDWKQGVEEGRHSKEFFEDKKVEHGEGSRDWQILYESKFPDSVEDSLIKWSWINNAVDREFSIDGRIIYGFDVAGAGSDLNVLTKIMTDGEKYKVLSIDSWSNEDTMQTTGKVSSKIDKKSETRIDAIGVGKGVADRLKEQGYNVRLIKVGEKSEMDTMLNKKAQYYWHLRTLFEENRISILDNNDLKKELSGLRVKYRSNDKRQIIDPDKSPDFADSLMLGCFKDVKKNLETGYIENPFAIR